MTINKENYKHLLYLTSDLTEMRNKEHNADIRKIYNDIISDLRVMYALLDDISLNKDIKVSHNGYKANVGKIRMGD